MNIIELLSNGLIFGVIDNLVLVAGVVWGCTCLEAWITNSLRGTASKRFCLGLGAVIGGGVGNTLSDLLGCLCDPTMIDATVGITVGTQIPLLPAYALWIILIIRSRTSK